MENIFEFIQNKMPLGALVFDENLTVIYQNSTAGKFLKRYGIAPALTVMAGQLFKKRQKGAGADTLPKFINFSGGPKCVPNNLSLRYLYSEQPFPRISVFISTKPCNGQLNVEAVIRRYRLTKKEGEIFRLLVKGLKNTDMARQLQIQAHTLRHHLKNIYMKCGVRSKLELVRNIAA